jgi:hypothetical protein
MSILEKFETLDITEAKDAVMKELSIRALRSVTEDTKPQKYYIRDTNNKIIGNPKGYPTYKGAERQANHGKARNAAWQEYYKHHDENPGSSNNLVHSIKLESEEIDTDVAINEEEYGYHENNPKIDLHNKHNGEYIASTNYAKSVKQAVQKYEEKFPDMKGSVRGYINKK